MKAEEGCYKSSELKNEESGTSREDNLDNWPVEFGRRSANLSGVCIRILARLMKQF